MESSEASVPTPAEASAPLVPLSKKAQKKAARKEKYDALKLERRAKEKQSKKAKKAEIAQKRAAGELNSDEEAELEENRRMKRPRLGRKASDYFDARIVIDLDFDDKMSDKEVASLTSQLAYVYAAHRRAAKPFRSLLFTGLGGRAHERLKSMNDSGYARWHECEWWQENYDRLWQDSSTPALSFGKGSPQAASTSETLTSNSPSVEAAGHGHAPEESVQADQKRPTTQNSQADKKTRPSRAPQSSVVYLTADSHDELSELREGETYIIGGIVDRNRYKNLCFDKAQKSGIRTARLPIGTYLASMPTRKVLTVNQVYEILLKWTETRDWESALLSVMPKRKFADSRATEQPISASGSTEPVVIDAEELVNDEDDHGESVNDDTVDGSL